MTRFVNLIDMIWRFVNSLFFEVKKWVVKKLKIKVLKLIRFSVLISFLVWEVNLAWFERNGMNQIVLLKILCGTFLWLIWNLIILKIQIKLSFLLSIFDIGFGQPYFAGKGFFSVFLDGLFNQKPFSLILDIDSFLIILP